MGLDINQLVWDFIRDHPAQLGGYAVLLLVFPLAIVVIPKYYTQIIDTLKQDKQPDFRILLGLLLLANLMFTGLEKLDSSYIPKFQEYIRYRLTRAVLEHYKEKPYDTQQVGELISMLVKLPLIVKELINHFRSDILPLLFVVVAMLAEFALIDVGLPAIVLGGIGAIWVICKGQIDEALDIAAEGEIQRDGIHQELAEIFENLPDVYAMGTEEAELERLTQMEAAASHVHHAIFTRVVGVKTCINLVATLVLLGCVYYAEQLRRQGKISVSKVVQVGVTLFFVVGKVDSVVGEVPGFVYNMGMYRKCRQFFLAMQSEQEMSVRVGAEVEVDVPLALLPIVWEDVNVQYEAETRPLKDFSLRVEPGTTLLITGTIGAGKSTLVKTLLGMVPYTGNVYLGSFNIRDLPLDLVRRTILYIPQSPPIMNRSLYETVAYGQPGVSRQRVEALWTKYDISALIPYDLDFVVGHRGEKLSGGQRMVLYLVRILLLEEPHILILDEPTASLDPESVQRVLDLVRGVVAHTRGTTLIISHDQRVEVLADQTIRLQDGRLVATSSL